MPDIQQDFAAIAGKSSAALLRLTVLHSLLCNINTTHRELSLVNILYHGYCLSEYHCAPYSPLNDRLIAAKAKGSRMEILVNPINKRIDAKQDGTLLDALLEHQVPVSYSCLSGRCGTCRCKVIEGDVSGPAAAEGRLAANGHYVLACQARVDSDCVIEVPEVDEVITHPTRTLKGTVTAIDSLAHNVRRVRIKTNKPLAFSPGQYAHLQFWAGAERAYSMAGLDSDDELEFHIRVIPDGRVTSMLDEKVTVGSKLKLSGPLGASYLRRKHEGPILCLAAGTGLAPILSIIRGALQSAMSNPITLFYGANTEADLYGLESLESLRRDYPQFQYEILLSYAGADSRYRRGLVTDGINVSLGNLADYRIYLAGSPAMVEAASMRCTEYGADIERIYADAFYPSGV